MIMIANSGLCLGHQIHLKSTSMEHIWDASSADPRELRDLCLDIWSLLPLKTYQGFVESMSRRISAILGFTGGQTGY